MKTPPLSDRLLTLARAVLPGETVCDVGSDHGYLASYLLKEGISPEVWVTDIREMPLQRAREELSRQNTAQRARFFLCDGIPEENGLPDVIVIAGMGADTIVHILSNAEGRFCPGARLFLQPMTKEDVLRSYLRESGFSVEREALVRENGKLFLSLFCVFDGKKRPPDPEADLFGEARFDAEPFREEYRNKIRKRLQTRIAGLEKAGLCAEKEKIFFAALQARTGEEKRENP